MRSVANCSAAETGVISLEAREWWMGENFAPNSRSYLDQVEASILGRLLLSLASVTVLTRESTTMWIVNLKSIFADKGDMIVVI